MNAFTHYRLHARFRAGLSRAPLAAESSTHGTPSSTRTPQLFRYSSWDAVFVTLAALHGVVAVAWPATPVIALGVWWNSNTIAHNFIHTPYFQQRALNRVFACYLSLLLGIPQTIWRERHLAHHAGVPWRPRFTSSLATELLLVVGLWGWLLAANPQFFLAVYLPGYCAGLGLCALHGYYEHVGGGTISHYGALYNWLFFNDGYHVEHHARPGTHWTRLPAQIRPDAERSRWPAVLRWLDLLSLESLERLTLKSRCLANFMLRSHQRAFSRLLPDLLEVHRVGIVGGGLFPRSALVLRRLLPEAELVIIDASAKNLEVARQYLVGHTELVHAWYDPARHNGFDLLVVPLAYIGDRAALYQQPAAPAVAVHDWIWRRRGRGTIISFLLLKRLNLVRA
jgi:hypothetical protein